MDFFDRGTWDVALAGVECLFLLFPLPGNRAARDAIIPFLRAAQDAGCRHVVYVSVFGADRARFIPHYKVEAALRSSSMTWTVLRCSFFMQNLHRHVSTHGTDIAEKGEVFIPAGRGRTTFIDARDAAAVAALELGYPVTYPQPGLIAFARRLRGRGVGWDTTGFMSVVYPLTRLGQNQTITDDVARLR